MKFIRRIFTQPLTHGVFTYQDPVGGQRPILRQKLGLADLGNKGKIYIAAYDE